MNNESFVFNESIYKTAKRLEKIKGKEFVCDFYNAVAEYGLYGTLPDEDSEIWVYGFDVTAGIINDDLIYYNYLEECEKELPDVN